VAGLFQAEQGIAMPYRRYPRRDPEGLGAQDMLEANFKLSQFHSVREVACGSDRLRDPVEGGEMDLASPISPRRTFEVSPLTRTAADRAVARRLAGQARRPAQSGSRTC